MRAQDIGSLANLANKLFSPNVGDDSNLPALDIMHTCGGVRLQLRVWAEQALKSGYGVLVPDGLRGLPSNCGSPPQISNARLIKDALDGMAHLASLPFVDSSRISVLGLSKGALVANWLASSSVSKALRPDTAKIAALVSIYGFYTLAPPPDSCLQQLPKLKFAARRWGGICTRKPPSTGISRKATAPPRPRSTASA